MPDSITDKSGFGRTGLVEIIKKIKFSMNRFKIALDRLPEVNQASWTGRLWRPHRADYVENKWRTMEKFSVNGSPSSALLGILKLFNF